MDELGSFPFHTVHPSLWMSCYAGVLFTPHTTLCAAVLSQGRTSSAVVSARERERERETDVREGIRLWIGAGIVQEKEDSSVLVGCLFSHSFSFFFRDFGRLGEEEEEEEEEKKGEEFVCCVLFFEFDCWSLLCKCVLDLCCLCGESEGVEYSLKQRGLLACLLRSNRSKWMLLE